MSKQLLAVQYLDATDRDADCIASLHAESWRRHYRGAYLDAYLDGDVVSDRQEVWRGRLAQPRGSQFTVIARQANELLGFAHTILDEDPRWGSLLENLHVQERPEENGDRFTPAVRGRQETPSTSAKGSLHLWVLDQNTTAQAFYDARGGTRVETQLRGPFPGGGRALGHRYYWTNSTRLLIGPEIIG